VQLDSVAAAELTKLREMYEPYANALGVYFLMALPAWLPSDAAFENWQITAWSP
jgi:hypothetical protein